MMNSTKREVASNVLLSRFGIRLAGAAGDGLQSSGLLFQKYFNRLGYYVYGHPGTQSTIRGGHIWHHIEFSSQNFFSFNRKLNLLIAINTQSIQIHLTDIVDGGFIIANRDKVKIENFKDEIEKRNINLIFIPMSSIARKIELKTPILANTVAVGAVLALLNLPTDKYFDTLMKRFVGRSSILKLNKNALLDGYNYYKSHYKVNCYVADPTLQNQKHFVVSGNEMIALGAVAAGLKYLAQYPITPSSSILTYLSNRASKYGIVVRQAEDELAAICMCIGASYTGARSMTASSGPGISLMSEALGYAAMTETPLVIVNSMRAGPSTGIPTKMEQGDLYSTIHMSHGESPRAVFSPRNIREAFDITVRAFNLADKYQIPVFILSDFALSESTMNLEPFNLDVENDRGLIWTKPTKEFPEFKRYELTESGISPRAFPGTNDAMHILVGAEHDERSHSLSGNRCGLQSSVELREKMFEKRFRKMELLRNEMTAPNFYGVENAERTIISWGSTQGAIKEVIDTLNSTTNVSWNMLSFVDLFPFPYNKVKELIVKTKFTLIIEVNYTGQLENLMHQHLDWRPDESIRPIGGETLTPSYLLELIKVKLPLLEVIE